jgi:chemotaxis protein methyltransferase CheR
MTQTDCIAFLQWALPRLERSWAGYRKVQGIVCKRLKRRLQQLGLDSLAVYRGHLETHPEEWAAFDSLLAIPISRFYRDRGVFACLESDVLPTLAQQALDQSRRTLVCWSAGCASGEEPYTLAIVWRRRLQAAFAQLRLEVVATDGDAALLDRARAGCYNPSSLKEMPPDLREAALEARGDLLCLRAPLDEVEFVEQDLRRKMPDRLFDLILCRNVVLTYYAPPVQRQLLAGILARLRPGGALVVGIHESVPEPMPKLTPWPGARSVYRRTAASAGS